MSNIGMRVSSDLPAVTKQEQRFLHEHKHRPVNRVPHSSEVFFSLLKIFFSLFFSPFLLSSLFFSLFLSYSIDVRNANTYRRKSVRPKSECTRTELLFFANTEVVDEDAALRFCSPLFSSFAAYFHL